jgi:predicted transposase YbfD/YdcC
MSSEASADHRPLVVRLVRGYEVPRFNALLDEHHFLGHHLFGQVLRYVATEGDDWVALLGFGSAALSLRPRDDYIGWSEEQKLRRLRYVANNQRFCVLPDARRPNLASAVLARTLRRLSSDAEAAYGHPVLLVETFTDPARHKGTCYAAANFLLAGETSGYGRRNGAWVYHGNKKLSWLYPLRRDANAVLSSLFDHPLLSSATIRKARMIDLNQIVIDGEAGLFARLCELPDHRKAKGIRHKLASVLLVCVVAMLAGNHNPTEIAEWAADLPDELSLRLHLRKNPSTGLLVAPSISTVQRTLRAVDREGLDRIVCQTLAEQVQARRAKDAEDAVRHETVEQSKAVASEKDGRAPEKDAGVDEAQEDAALFAIAVDGKSLRGAIQDDGRAVHLFAAMTHDERVVIGQEEVDHKTNEIKAFRPLLGDLDLAGCIVTADAMHAQRDHAQFLVEEKHADFLLFVKENQPNLHAAIVDLDESAWSKPYTDVCKGHGRIETRTVQVALAPANLPAFPHVAQLVRIFREVNDAKTNTARWTETAYAITSCSPKRAGRRRLAIAARGHWSIENGLHWVRDVTMREDSSKVRSGSAPRALATMRNLVISVLHLAGATNIAKSLRTISRRPELAFTLLGL